MNWDQIKTLLAVIHSASQAGPKYQKIVSAADKLLWEIFDGVPAEDTAGEDETAPRAIPSSTMEPSGDASTLAERRI